MRKRIAQWGSGIIIAASLIIFFGMGTTMVMANTPTDTCCTTDDVHGKKECIVNKNGHGNKNKDCDDSNACTMDACVNAGCVYTPVICEDNNSCTTNSCNPATGCVFTPVVCQTGSCDPATGCNLCSDAAVRCNDNNDCTADSCDATTGSCVHDNNNTASCDDGIACTVGDNCSGGVCVGIPITDCGGIDTMRNNFTMLDHGGNLVGGSSEVRFTWDGTKKTSVAVSGQVSNATLSSTAAFLGHTWLAHDVAIYGPGIYTVYADCAAGSPGCGEGAPITFTVAMGEMAAHMLLDWNGNKNTDVVNVWTPAALFGPNPMWTSTYESNTNNKVWDWMSKDPGTGVNGYEMLDGPFAGFNANFNVMGITGVSTRIGVSVGGGKWWLDMNGSRTWDAGDTFNEFEIAGGIPLMGDWDGNGTIKIGVFRDGVWYLDNNGILDSSPAYTFGGGMADALPVTGDWTGNGSTKIGVYHNGSWYLDLNGNGAWDGTPTDALYSFGNGVANSIPVTGDWTGTGTTKIGIYADGIWYLDLNGNGVWDGAPTDGQYSFGGGVVHAIPATGDWTGTGTTKIGIYADGIWYLDLNGNRVWDEISTDTYYFFGNGVAGAVPVTGKW